MLQFVSGSLNEPRFVQRYADSMFRLRYRVFHERLGWQVRGENGREVDAYDDGDSRYLLVADGPDVVGGWRLRPSTRPYMLEGVFPQLLGDNAAPRHGRIWEVSRFAIDTEALGARGGYGLNDAALQLMRGTTQYAIERGIDRYVMVASAAAERLYRHAGLVVHRFAPPQRVGGVLSVGCWIDVDDATCRTLLGHPLPLPVAA